MKVRAGFVSNSSSTSFLIVSKDELNREDFLELMGISPDSPVVGLFDSFFEIVLSSISERVDFNTTDPSESVVHRFDGKYGRGLSQHMLDKLEIAKRDGLKAYFGTLSSESTMIESFFCTDSFEVESDKIYFNGLESAW